MVATVINSSVLLTQDDEGQPTINLVQKDIRREKKTRPFSLCINEIFYETLKSWHCFLYIKSFLDKTWRPEKWTNTAEKLE